MIEIQHLNLTFGEGEKRNQVLDDVNISVRDGEIYGLVGESGSGKTTVLKCLAGLFTHWEGELAINGKRLENVSARNAAAGCRWYFRIRTALCIRVTPSAIFWKSRCTFTA